MLSLCSRRKMLLVIVLICTLVISPFTSLQPAYAEEPDLIPLDPSMVINESGREDAGKFVDNDTSTFWNPGKPYPASAYIDLGQRYDIHQVSFFDLNGSFENAFVVEYGTPGQWIHLFSDNLGVFNNWVHKPVEIRTRYIRVTKNDYTPFGEIQLYGTPVPPDHSPPGEVTDLTAIADGYTVRLEWTAPGNDGHVGTAASYDIRYSDETITDENWDEATPLPDIPNPQEAGTAEQLLVHGLPEDTEFFFAMKVSDDWDIPNVSGLSNVARVVTNADTFAPTAITDLRFTVVGSRAVTLEWTATGDNDQIGTASVYELRYHTVSADVYDAAAQLENWWNEAVPVHGLPIPQASGQTERFEVTGLDAETDYYFAIIARDKMNNASSFSNVLHVKTSDLDRIPPSTITNVSVTVPDLLVSSANLSWSAPGDDGDEGTATAYEVRYSTQPATDPEAWWNDAQALPGAPLPAAAGTHQSMSVTGLDTGVYYFAAIRAMDEDGNLSGISNVVKFGFAKKLDLDPSMIINESGAGNASALVDEQELAGDPANNNTGNPKSNWTNVDKWLTTYSAVIDLGAPHYLKDLYLFDSNGGSTAGEVHVRGYVGEPTDWQWAFDDSMGSYNAWNKHELDTESQFVRIEMLKGIHPIEVVLYGIAYDIPEEVIVPEETTYALMRDLIGVNGFIDDPIDRLAVAGTVREYHNWRWDEPLIENYPNNGKAFAPSNAAGGSWNFDTYYTYLNEIGVEVFPNIKDSVRIYGDSYNVKPVFPDQDPTDPFSYEPHADHMFQYAARYGFTEVDPSLLKLREDQPVRSGLGLITYFENENEPNKNWFNRAQYYTPYEYAAMMSADYDGHMRLMGTTVGVKNADPNAKLVMAGLVGNGLDLQYLQAIKFWSDYHRANDEGYEVFPVDVINFHHYCRKYSGNDYVGISPEEDQMREKLQVLVDWKNQHAPGVEVWLSEFGYDTHPESPQRATAIKDFSHEEVQAQWLVRSFLAIAAAGVDRAQIYMLRDVDPNCATQYCTSGLTSTQATGYVQKPSWYYIYTLKNHLGDMRFEEEIVDPDYPGVMNYKFASDSGEKAYVLWSPTSEQIEISDYPFQIGGDWEQMTQITLTDKQVNGAFTYLPVTDGKVTLTISENPIILREGTIEDTTPPFWEEGSALAFEELSASSVELSWPQAQGERAINYYSVYNGDKVIAAVPASVRSYVVTGLEEGAAYDFKVYAGDVIGKESQALTVTMVQSDKTPPTKPQNVAVLISTSSQVMLSWTGSTDNIGVIGYRIYRDDHVLAGTAPSNGTIYTVNGLNSSTDYTFIIRAVDAEGNESEASEPVTARTLAAPSSGGSSGGSYTPSPSPSPTPAPSPSSSDNKGGSSVPEEGNEEQLVVITNEQLRDELEHAMQDSDQAPVIRLSAPSSATSATFEISAAQWGQIQRQAPEAVLSFQVDRVSYELPIRAINLADIAEQHGVDMDEFTVRVEVLQADWATYIALLQSADQQHGELLSDVYSFELIVEKADGERIHIEDFGATYVERTMLLPRYLHQHNLTAVRYDLITGSLQFVPATFEVTPEGTIATIKSNGNSLYAIVSMNRTFKDIESSFAREDIERLASKQIIFGKSQDRFDPSGQMKRGEFTALIVRSLGIKVGTDSVTGYLDIPEARWDAGVIAAAERAELVDASAADTDRFRPDDAITREEAAIMLYRALQYGGEDEIEENDRQLIRFLDGADVSPPARAALNAILEIEIMIGYPDQTLRPTEMLTREQCAIMLRKLLEHLAFI